MVQNIIHTPNLLKNLANKDVVVDTCAIIEASKNDAFLDLLYELKRQNCTLLSVFPVQNEFLAVASNQQEYNELKKFLEDLDITFLPRNIEHKFEDKGKSFSIALRRSKVRKPSYVDRLLLSIPYLYKHVADSIYVMTSNHRDVPLEFFNLTDYVVWNKKDGFSEIGLYQFDQTKFNEIVDH